MIPSNDTRHVWDELGKIHARLGDLGQYIDQMSADDTLTSSESAEINRIGACLSRSDDELQEASRRIRSLHERCTKP